MCFLPRPNCGTRDGFLSTWEFDTCSLMRPQEQTKFVFLEFVLQKSNRFGVVQEDCTQKLSKEVKSWFVSRPNEWFLSTEAEQGKIFWGWLEQCLTDFVPGDIGNRPMDPEYEKRLLKQQKGQQSPAPSVSFFKSQSSERLFYLFYFQHPCFICFIIPFSVKSVLFLFYSGISCFILGKIWNLCNIFFILRWCGEKTSPQKAQLRGICHAVKLKHFVF